MYTRKGYYQDREIDPFVTGVSCEQNKLKLVIMEVKMRQIARRREKRNRV